MLKVLVLSVLNRRPCIDELFLSLSSSFDVVYEKLNIKNQQDFSLVDRICSSVLPDVVVLDLPHSFLRRFSQSINNISALVIIYEEDACQNFMPDSRWHGDFSRFYKAIPDAHVVVTGGRTSRLLSDEGVRTFHLSKGFDSSFINNFVDQERVIPLGFIGALGSNAYFERQRMLRYMEALSGLSILRTSPGREYFDTLSKIEVFFSADCGIGEYMAKNFEAMAAGCLLMAYHQGDGEEELLGLVDGENILLYRSVDEAVEKYNWIKSNPDLIGEISKAGKDLARTSFSLASLSSSLVNYIKSVVVH